HRVGGDGSVAAEDVREGELRAAEGGPEASVEGVVVVGQVLRRAALAGDGAVVAASGVVVEAAVNANNVAGANLQIATRGEGDDAAAGVRRDRPWHHCRHVGTAVEAADVLIEEDDVAGVGVLDRFVQLKGEAGVRGHRGRAVRRHDGHDLRRNWARCLDGKSVGDGQIAVGRVGDGDVVRSQRRTGRDDEVGGGVGGAVDLDRAGDAGGLSAYPYERSKVSRGWAALEVGEGAVDGYGLVRVLDPDVQVDALNCRNARQDLEGIGQRGLLGAGGDRDGVAALEGAIGHGNGGGELVGAVELHRAGGDPAAAETHD